MANVNRKVLKELRANGVRVLSRRQWGNTSTVYQQRRILKRHHKLPSDTLVQHITVTHDDPDFKKVMQALHRIGMERFGSGVSYNFVISMKTGTVGVGQSLDAKGTHTINDKEVPGFSHDQNYWAHAIAFVGMPGDKLSPAAINSAKKLVQALVNAGALTPGHDYVPHRLFAWKDCPTDNVVVKMHEIDKNFIKES